MYHTITFLIMMMGHVECLYAGNITLTDNSIHQTIALPKNYLSQITNKSHSIEAQVNKRADKVLERFARQEKRMQGKLWKVDSVAAKNILLV